MSDINPRDFIEELRFDIKVGDQIKARLVLSHFDEVDLTTRKMSLLELSRAPDEFVIPLLVALTAGTPRGKEVNGMLREMLYSKSLDSPDILSRLLIREVNPAHRLVLAQIVGEIRLESAAPTLLSILIEERDEKVLRGAIAALGLIGDPSATTPISEFLYSGSVELIIAAIQALGQLGTPTAVQRLAEKLGADPELDYMILDVFAACQEPEALERLNATLLAQHAHLRNAGKQRLIAIGPKAVPALIKNLRYDDPDLVIHTLNVLGAIGDDSAIAPIRKMLFNEPKNPNVRFAAYDALGRLPVEKGAFALAQGLQDTVDNVRAAAAKAIDHNYNTVLAAGIKNMIRDEEERDKPICRTIMDAHCDRLFLDLITENAFADFATIYLGRKAHAETRKHFIGVLVSNGMAELAARIDAESVENKPRRKPRVFAVDDSRMILNIYRSVLHNLGYEPVLFEFPAQAIEQVRIAPPDLIFTDLNMPEISGVALTRAVRRLYSATLLPIVMVTTQSECHDNEAAMAAGIDAIIQKPFNEQSLKTILDKYRSMN
jgi:CheY-like chemotaxis protein/HEAT repeat protein